MFKPNYILIAEDVAEQADMLVSAAGNVFAGVDVQVATDLLAARQFLRVKPKDQVGLALVDLGLGSDNGLDLIADMAQDYPDVLPVVVTIFDDDAHLFDAFRTGAQGYVLKTEGDEALRVALRQAADGVSPLSPRLVGRMIAYFRQEGKSAVPDVGLTPRETEVLGLLGRGMRVSEVAKDLGLSEYTVGDHVKAIYRKLNVSSRAAVAVEAVRRGLVS